MLLRTDFTCFCRSSTIDYKPNLIYNRKMKRAIPYVALALMLASCRGDASKFTLQGAVDTLYNGAQAILSYGSVSDSVEVVDGKFTFEGSIDTAVLARVAIPKGDGQISGQLVLEPGTPTMDFTGRTAVCGGTPLNEAYNAYNKRMVDISAAYMDSYMALREQTELTEEERESKMNEAFEVYAENNRVLNEELFASNTNNVLGAVALLSMAKDAGQFDSLYSVAGDIVRRDAGVEKERVRYENLKKTSEGRMFTDFTVKNGAADGSAVSLSEYVGKGKYVLVDFWASWCGPCRLEIPNLAEVYKKYKGDRFEIVGVAVYDKRADTEKAMTELPITWPVIFEAEARPAEIYGIRGIPEIILFGPDGTILARDLYGEGIGEKVAEYLNEE